MLGSGRPPSKARYPLERHLVTQPHGAVSCLVKRPLLQPDVEDTELDNGRVGTLWGKTPSLTTESGISSEEIFFCVPGTMDNTAIVYHRDTMGRQSEPYRRRRRRRVALTPRR